MSSSGSEGSPRPPRSRRTNPSRTGVGPERRRFVTVDLFDVNAMVGPGATTADVAEDVSALLNRMDRLRIAEAVVVHTHAWRHDVATGNRLAVEQVGGHERLHPGWMVLPDTC